MNKLTLYVDGKNTGISVQQDSVHPEMWRVHRRGEVSDMVNLSRAKDAAAVMGRERINHRGVWKAAKGRSGWPPVRLGAST
jgi:hypothetical protein